jgi:transportin-1
VFSGLSHSAPPQYQRKSLRYLYDAMGTVATAVGSALAAPQFASALLPPLLAKWQTHAADDKEQLPLLDCLAQVIPSVGASFEPYAAPFYQRCVGMLQLQEQYKRGECAGREYDPDYVVRRLECRPPPTSHHCAQVCALDAVSSLVDALRTSLDAIIASPPLRDWVFLVCVDANPCVRQSGFALMGDLAKFQPAHLMATLQRCLEVCCAALQPDQLQPECMKACTNAGWSIGELVIRAPVEELQLVAVPLMQVLAPVLSVRTSTSKGLLENAAISLGRLALRCPQPLAPYLKSFAEPWCVALRRVHDGQEKEQAFGGLCALVHQNPLAAWPFFLPLGNAFASWRTQNDEALHRSMAEILRGYKAHLPAADWEAGWARLEPAVRTKLGAWFF